jgi:hypothetical protein
MNFTFTREPAVYISVIAAILNAAVLFGLKISPDQKTAIMTVITLASGIWIRSQVFAPKSQDGAPLVGVKYEGGTIQPVK